MFFAACASRPLAPAGPTPSAWFPLGALNSDVTQETLQSTICLVGWTKTIRPPTSYTNRLKREQMAERNLPGKPSDYEEDHFIPLELGGHPTDPVNLWPEPWAGACGARTKDRLENDLHRRVCAGTLSLTEAQQAVRSSWTDAYRRFVDYLACS